MNDDFNRAPQTPPQQIRKPFTQNRYGNTGPGYNSYNQNNSNTFNSPQHPKRRTDRFKRESLNTNDKISRQNDIIIRLLKEIRDRLPPPPVTANETGIPATQEQENPQLQMAAPQDEQQQEVGNEAAEPGNENHNS